MDLESVALYQDFAARPSVEDKNSVFADKYTLRIKEIINGNKYNKGVGTHRARSDIVIIFAYALQLSKKKDEDLN